MYPYFQFEWAWQHPHISRRLKHMPVKKSGQRVFKYCLIVLSEMLKVGPWCRLPLTVRWLDHEFFEEYFKYVSAPIHMPMCYGKVISKKIDKASSNRVVNEMETLDKSLKFCSICGSCLEGKELVSCIKPNCSLTAHVICLANIFSKDMILPVEGTCPVCNTNILWGDLIRKKLGCYDNFQEISSWDDD